MTADIKYTPVRYATEKQLQKIHYLVYRDWGLSDTFKNLVWQKDLSKLSIGQASRLIKYILFHDEHYRYILYATRLLDPLPDSPDYIKMMEVNNE